MKYFPLLIAVVCSVTGLPAVRDDERISGSFYPLPLAKSGDFPYVVSITENDRHFCGGFIYSERWIITSASCVEGKTIAKLKVIVGQVNAINPDPNEQSFIIYSITPVPSYNSTTKENDIALLQLSTDIQFDYVNVDFAAYNEVNYVLPPVIMGWGEIFSGTLESANLHYGDIGIVNSFKRPELCGGVLFNFATMMCASSDVDLLTESNDFITPPGPQTVWPCKYDEGSPMVQINADTGVPTVVGILSRTDGCSVDSYSVYTRVSVYFSWLINTAGPQPTRSTVAPTTPTTTPCTTTTYTTTDAYTPTTTYTWPTTDDAPSTYTTPTTSYTRIRL